jgi:hypothetical protein
VKVISISALIALPITSGKVRNTIPGNTYDASLIPAILRQNRLMAMAQVVAVMTDDNLAVVSDMIPVM